MYFPHPRFRRRTQYIVAISVFGISACQRSVDQSAIQPADSTYANAAHALRRLDDFGNPLPTDASFGARVVSLNPTATEIIFAIGADSQLIGRGRWDEFPLEARHVPDVGDGIRPNIEIVLAAKPTLVILYATAENRAAAVAFANAGIRTIALRVDHIAQFEQLTTALGVALGATERAAIVADTVRQTLARVRAITHGVVPRTVVWPLWQSPVIVVGRGSYLDELLEIAGAKNVFHDISAPSPTVNVEEIAQRNPDVVVASPTAIQELWKRPQWRAVRAVRDSDFVVDVPAYTGRPSVVLGMAAVMLARALHPELANDLPPLPSLRDRTAADSTTVLTPPHYRDHSGTDTTTVSARTTFARRPS